MKIYKILFYALGVSGLLAMHLPLTAQECDSVDVRIKHIVSPGENLRLEYGHERIDINSPIIGRNYLLFLDSRTSTIFLLNRKNNLIEDKLYLKAYRKKERLDKIKESGNYIDINIQQIDDSTVYTGLVSRANEIFLLLLNVSNGTITPEIKPIPNLSTLPPEVPKLNQPKLCLSGYYRQDSTECFVFNFFLEEQGKAIYATYIARNGALELLEHNVTAALMNPATVTLNLPHTLTYNRHTGIIKRYSQGYGADSLAAQKNGLLFTDVVNRRVYLIEQQKVDSTYQSVVYEIRHTPYEVSAALTIRSDTRLSFQSIHANTAYLLLNGIDGNRAYLYGLNLNTHRSNVVMLKNYRE